VNFCGFRCATTSPITVFYKLCFLHLYLLLFIPLYVDVICLQHSVTYHGRVTVRLIFTALHGMQTRSSDENSVCPSVTRVNCDKMVERSAQIYIPYERIFSLVFWEEEWLVGGDPFYLKFWVNRPPLEQSPILNRLSLVAPQP